MQTVLWPLTLNLSAADLEFVRPFTAKGTKNTESRMGFIVADTVKAYRKRGEGDEHHIPVLLSPVPKALVPEPEATELDPTASDRHVLHLTGAKPVFWGYWKKWGRSTRLNPLHVCRPSSCVAWHWVILQIWPGPLPNKLSVPIGIASNHEVVTKLRKHWESTCEFSTVNRFDTIIAVTIIFILLALDTAFLSHIQNLPALQA